MVKFTDDSAPSGGPAPGDIIPIVDVSDTTDDPAGSSKADTIQNVANAIALTNLSNVDTDKSKAPADGDVLTYDGTDWNAETPAVGGGGGNPYGADIVVAASGGDYTDLSTALAAATANQVIYVEAGSYSNAGVTVATEGITVIGQSRESTQVTFNSSATMTFSGDNVIIKNIRFNQSSTGTIQFTGDNAVVQDCYFHYTSSNTTLRAFYTSGERYVVANNYFQIDGNGADRLFEPAGAYGKIIGNHFELAYNSNDVDDGVLNIHGQNNTFSNNTVRCVAVNTAGQGFITFSTNESAITGNTFEPIATTMGGVVLDSCYRSAFTGNQVKGGTYSLWVDASSDIVVSGNMFTTYDDGIINASSSVSITGNAIYSYGGIIKGNGIELTSGTDKNTVTANTIRNFQNGISIADATCDANHLIGNVILDNGTAISDGGTGTVTANNITS